MESPARNAVLYSDVGLAALERYNQTGPQTKVIQRLIANVRQARAEADERGWKLTELEAQHEHDDELRKLEAERLRHRVLVVVEPDGYGQVFADQSVTVKVVLVLPWQDSHEMMLDDKSHWSELWCPGLVRKTFRPHYLSEPNRLSEDAVYDMGKWFTNLEVLEKLIFIKGLLIF